MQDLSSSMELRSNKSWTRSLSDTEIRSFSAATSLSHNPAIGFPHHHSRSEPVGSGAQAYVEAWMHNVSKSLVVVKVFKTSSYKAPNEVEILKMLPPHRSIVTMLGYVPQSASVDGPSVIFEHCKLGDLWDIEKVLSVEGQLAHREGFLWSVYSQLSEALAFLHEGIGRPDPTGSTPWRPVVHRDIKKENIFVVSKGPACDGSTIKIKLGDFGLAAFYDPKHARMPPRWGTMDMWPPEQTWEKPDARPAGDIWAIGSVLHELVHGFPPIVDPAVTRMLWVEEGRPFEPGWRYDGFWSTKSPRIPFAINVDPAEHPSDPRRVVTGKYSDRLNACMMAALEHDPKKRATAGKLLTMVEQEYAAWTWEHDPKKRATAGKLVTMVEQGYAAWNLEQMMATDEAP